MIRVNPLSLQVDSSDRYRLRCESEKGIEEFTFSFDRETGMMTSDQREFYFATYDDDGTDSLNSALVHFDRAVRASAQTASIPVGITVADPGYEVRCKSNDGTTAYHVAMENGAPVATELQSGFAGNAIAIKQLTDAMVAFHRARKISQPGL